MKERLAIVTLGCPRNLADSENIAGRLRKQGYSIVEDIGKAEIALVNTCAFIDEAKRESIDVILDLINLKKEGKIKKIIVNGCLAQRYKSLKKQFPEVDEFRGVFKPGSEETRFALTPKHYAYLKICEGCVNNCSYCIIPKIKGKIKSLGREEIIRKVREFNRQKISELNIIGQDITGYGIDKKAPGQLPVLLKEIIKNSPDIPWIRLLYLNPERISDELLGLIAKNRRICKYIDVPIQHINNRILRLMNRKITAERIALLIKKIREIIPGVCLRTSLIVGFPSESEKEFNELVEFIREVKFDRLGAFMYSREEGTSAYNLKGQIDDKIKQRRFDVVMAEQQKIASELNAKLLGKTIPVLIEENQGKCAYLGRSQNDAPEVDGVVYCNSKNKLQIGKIIQVRITDTLEYDLVGEPKS